MSPPVFQYTGLGNQVHFWDAGELVVSNSHIQVHSSLSFGLTDMLRVRFDDVWQCIRFSQQPTEWPAWMSSETYRWLMVACYVEHFNNHGVSIPVRIPVRRIRFALTSRCHDGTARVVRCTPTLQ